MHVLLLSPEPDSIASAISTTGDRVTPFNDDWRDLDYRQFNFVVSYGYRRIIKEPWISHFDGRMINLHISLLPWNRGAAPNFFSWLHRTPKGATIHEIDAGIDTGNILVRRQVHMQESDHTLRTSYDVLKNTAVQLFADEWRNIRFGNFTRLRQFGGSGDSNTLADFEKLWPKFPLKYETPVADVAALGRELMLPVYF
jgi:methionyl-tRNA formyltransferase